MIKQTLRSAIRWQQTMIRQALRSAVRKLGYDVVTYKAHTDANFSADFDRRYIEIIEKVKPFTITSNERLSALIESVAYILRNNIPGSFVECGVYRGGSMMAIAETLLMKGFNDRELYLFDTFEGMPKPGEKDIDYRGIPAIDKFTQTRISDVSSTWTNASLWEVQKAMSLTGYPGEKVKFIKGLVEETIPQNAPESIALLRLDTDWYRSSLHEMTYLYPRVSPKGIIIIDDYGHHKGAREAVDEYFLKNKQSPFLHRIDYAGRLIIKDGDGPNNSL